MLGGVSTETWSMLQRPDFVLTKHDQRVIVIEFGIVEFNLKTDSTYQNKI